MLDFAAFTDFERRKVVPYSAAAALAGALTAAAIIYFLQRYHIRVRDQERPGPRPTRQQLSAMFFNTYAPNPTAIGTSSAAMAQVSHVMWFVTEVIMTGVLVFGVFFLGEEGNAGPSWPTSNRL